MRSTGMTMNLREGGRSSRGGMHWRNAQACGHMSALDGHAGQFLITWCYSAGIGDFIETTRLSVERYPDLKARVSWFGFEADIPAVFQHDSRDGV